MNAHRRWWRQRLRLYRLPLACLLLAVLLGAIYARSLSYDSNDYFANVALLRQVGQLDAQWELDAMKSRIGLNPSYDALAHPLEAMHELPLQIKASSPQLAAALDAYQETLSAKAALMEAFKSHNAVLHNSLDFLPVAADDIGAPVNLQRGHRLEAMGHAEAAAHRLLLALLIYSDGPSESGVAEVERELAALEASRAGLSGELAERIDTMSAHARTVLVEQAAVDRLLTGIAAAPTDESIDAISALLGQQQQLAMQRLHAYRYGLILLAALLVGLLAYTALRLLRSHATVQRVNAELKTANDHLEGRVQERTAELLQANQRLQQEMAERKALQSRLVQSEKLASIGQLAAGVAHEINNPLAFLASNFGTLEDYLDKLFELLGAYEQAEPGAASHEAVARSRSRVDLAYLKQDIPALVAESRGGMERVGKIVQDLKQFSRVEATQDWEWADLRTGLQSTLNLIGGDLEAVADIQTEFGPMLEIECMPSQLNQVFLHLLQNAAQAIGPERGRITVRCGSAGSEVWLEVSDTGGGIAAEALPRIFDPFYTTRPIGKGTGLGLSLSYGIVQNHYGRIDVQSTPGRGSTFRVTLPVSHRMAQA
ncbi:MULTISPECIES: DAHL domain-containing protein [unclassified Duganella]|uniref:DAHL domain-containing protein n=1 Tax=unclassified Duganella TaxID=2636909 RepID=UPI001E613CF0|nr:MULTISPECIES: DAHL domain-containing protein [unclassified Duganella]